MFGCKPALLLAAAADEKEEDDDDGCATVRETSITITSGRKRLISTILHLVTITH